MKAVWTSRQHSGTHRLMLLAIADYSQDDGTAWPSVPTLARKCLMGERNARYILSDLVASGALTVQTGKGPKGSNVYKIKLDSLGVQQSAGVQSFAGVQQGSPTPCNTVPLPPATQCSQTIIEPSNNRQCGFDEFWSAYPKKLSKGYAQKAWNRIKPNAVLRATMLQAIEAQKNSDGWTKDNGKFIPHPATWLNGRRWEDETSRECSLPGKSLLDMPGMMR